MIMLQGAINGAASYGASFWRETACSYPFVQQYIGYCPSVCDYFPSSLYNMCQTTVSTVGPYVTPIAESLTPLNAVYGTLAVASAYIAWNLYQRTEGQQEINEKHDLVLQTINKLLLGLEADVAALNKKMDKLTPEQKIEEIDKIKRARDQLAAYMKQAGVSDIFYGDKIREMGLEIQEKRAEGEPLLSSKNVATKEKVRLNRAIAAAAEQAKKRKSKGPAFELHVAKDEPLPTTPVISLATPTVTTFTRDQLMAQIKEVGGQKKKIAPKPT